MISLKDEKGQTSVEYLLLVVVGAMLAFRFTEVAKYRLHTMTNDIFEEAEVFLQAMK